MTEQIKKGLETLGISVTDQAHIMAEFVEDLLQQNQVMNLTAITKPEEVVSLHLLDSAQLASAIPNQAKTLIDVGTGAGFPGIPLSILCPQLEVTLMDALEKRLLWLEEEAEKLGLNKVGILHGRGEELSHMAEYREKFHVATARAVAEMGILAELVLPFVEVGGVFLAMKSTQEEIESSREHIRVLGGEISEQIDYVIPGTDVSHRLIVVKKVAPTPTQYPRRWAKLKKNKTPSTVK